jgi:hypothetical protein
VSGQLHVSAALPQGKVPQSQFGRFGENSWPFRDSNSDPSVVQPVANRYTDWALQAPIIFQMLSTMAPERVKGMDHWTHRAFRKISYSVYDAATGVRAVVRVVVNRSSGAQDRQREGEGIFRTLLVACWSWPLFTLKVSNSLKGSCTLDGSPTLCSVHKVYSLETTEPC